MSDNVEELDPVLPRGECVDFARYPHLHQFRNDFTLGWLRFSNLGNRPLDVWNRTPQDDTGSGIRFDKQGLKVTLSRTTQTLTVVGNTGAGPLSLVAYDSGDAEVERATISQAPTPTTISLNAESIHALIMSDSVEPIISSICIASIDPGDVFDDAIRSGMDRDDVVRRYLGDPRGAHVLQNGRREFVDYYLGIRFPQTGGGLGSGIGVDFDWPPDWTCVGRNIALYLAITIALIILCQALGITFLALATETAVTFIVTTFGVSAETALVIYWSVRLTGATIGAFYRCGVFGS